jgi:metal-dependent HD superfamily phosphatase/phosphodiesterase
MADDSDERRVAESLEGDSSAGNGRVYDPDDDHAFPDERVNDVLAVVDEDPEIQTYLEAQNVNPVKRKRYNDHGTKHIEIVRNRAL